MNTNLSIEEIQEKTFDEIQASLTDLAPQVLEAQARYQELVAQQRRYLAARTLNEAGLRIGDKVQLRGTFAGKKNPIGRVLEPGMYLMFQALRRDGKPYGEPVSELMFDSFYKI